MMSLPASRHAAPERNPAQQAHVRRIGWAMLVYGLILIPSAYAASRHLLTAPWSYLVAMAAAAPLLAVFASWQRYIGEERDEYLRALAMTRIILATNLTLALCVLWGFLQTFDHLQLISLNWVPAIWLMTERAVAAFQRLHA